MIDPLLSLAFSIHANKGAYAVLLGSGVSRAAEIPTGWEIVLDLVRRLAKLEGVDCGAAPEAWFRAKYKSDPDYGQLLDALCPTPAERQQLLRGYFEPGEDDTAQGRKMPTSAHRVIAEWVAAGYVRLIITTNFDRLIERALEQAGVAPSVISTTDAACGMLPLAHSKATVVKLHGDYLDVRIRNTPTELARYDAEIDRLLDRAFDEYGLIVCGWSGDWDTALRAALERCPSRRFTTYWTHRSPPSDVALRLIQLRGAQLIEVEDAGVFFESLQERIQALEEFTVSHPLSARIAVVTVKRHLSEPPPHIRLHDLIHAETERVYAECAGDVFSAAAFDLTEEVKERLSWVEQPDPLVRVTHDLLNRLFYDRIALQARRYEALLDVLLAAVMTGVRWGGGLHGSIWSGAIERLGNPRILDSLCRDYRPSLCADASKLDRRFWVWGSSTGRVPAAVRLATELSFYPALLLTWGAGLAATAANDLRGLSAVLREPRLFIGDEPLSLLPSLSYLSVQTVAAPGPASEPIPWFHPRFAVPADFSLHPDVRERIHIPLSFHLYDFFRPRMRDWLPHERSYRECFDRFEHLFVVVRGHLDDRSRGSPFPWGSDWYWSGFGTGQPRLGQWIANELDPRRHHPDGTRYQSNLRKTLFDDVREDDVVFAAGRLAVDTNQGARSSSDAHYALVRGWNADSN